MCRHRGIETLGRENRERKVKQTPDHVSLISALPNWFPANQ